MKECSKGSGHMTNMAACPYMVKTSMTLKFGMQHWVLKYYKGCSNDDPEMTLTCFMAMSNLIQYVFVWEKGKTMYFFRK